MTFEPHTRLCENSETSSRLPFFFIQTCNTNVCEWLAWLDFYKKFHNPGGSHKNYKKYVGAIKNKKVAD